MNANNDFILTADPDFIDLAFDEVEALCGEDFFITPLAADTTLIESPLPFLSVAEQWRQQPPIFLRHICPAQFVISLQGERNTDLAVLQTLVTEQLILQVDPMLTMSVQTRILADLPYKPFDLNTALAQTLTETTGVTIDVRSPQQILSVICAKTPDYAELRTPHSAFLGLSLAADNLSDWAGGMRRFAREEGQLSRSEFKLLEALEVFHIDLPPRGVALDLGAAPGGWTRILRQREQYVTAIDPGALDARLANDRGVRHRLMTAEAYLATEPDPFDLIVNDMRMDARDSARLMVAYARYLYPHGIALMTLKLPEQEPRPILEHALHILRTAYQVVGVRQLFHNRSEVTVYLRPGRTSAD